MRDLKTYLSTTPVLSTICFGALAGLLIEINRNNMQAELDLFLRRHMPRQLRWNDSVNKKLINNIKVYCILLRMKNPREILISSIQMGEMSLDLILFHKDKDLTLTELMRRGIFFLEPIRTSVKNDGQFIMYQTIGISLVDKSKYQTNQRYQEERYVSRMGPNCVLWWARNPSS